MKWPEVISLGVLNAAIVISWIAYHEYQPKLLQGFGLNHLSGFLLYAKAAVLILVPPIAGYITDLLLKKGSKYFLVFTVGISLTAMTFMAVASFLGAGSVQSIQTYVPFLIIIWLVAMNIFTGPANSMIDMFSSTRKLPIIMAVLFFISEVVYALEPVIVKLITFFGPTITFAFGGVLITATGFIFHKVSSNEVIERQEQMGAKTGKKSKYLPVILVSLLLGLCHALLVEYLPSISKIPVNMEAKLYSTILLVFAAVVGLPLSFLIVKGKIRNFIIFAIPLLLAGASFVLFAGHTSFMMLAGTFLLAAAYSILGVSSLPFTIQNLSSRNLTFGVGIFFGVTELADAIFEIFVI